MTIGGLTIGVTPIDMAHAYSTLAENGRRISGTLGTDRAGPVGIRSVNIPGQPTQVNRIVSRQVIPPYVASTEDAIMHTVLTQGTGTAAQFGVYAAGKTGTTSNYVDAWFDGFTSKLTVAVWVGYPTHLQAMNTDFQGSPVLGGTFPALIWRDFMVRAYAIFANRAAQAAAKSGGKTGTTGLGTVAPASSGSAGQATGTGVTAGGGTGGSATDNAPPAGTGNGNATANPTGAANQNGPNQQATGNGGGTGTGTGTQTPAGSAGGAGTPTPAPPPATPAGTPTPATPPASTPNSGAGASGGASAPSG